MAYVRLSQVHFSAEARGPHLSPCFTPVCGFITVILLVVEMCELTKPSKPEEDLQDPGEAQGPVGVQLLGAEAGEAASPSALSPQSPSLPLWKPCPRKLLMRWWQEPGEAPVPQVLSQGADLPGGNAEEGLQG